MLFRVKTETNKAWTCALTHALTFILCKKNEKGKLDLRDPPWCLDLDQRKQFTILRSRCLAKRWPFPEDTEERSENYFRVGRVSESRNARHLEASVDRDDIITKGEHDGRTRKREYVGFRCKTGKAEEMLRPNRLSFAKKSKRVRSCQPLDI